MRSDHPHRQRGQVLPLATLLLLAVAATLFYMFNGGQLVQEKLRLTNTADAVAYSAGVFEARMLNYDAYTNRAIIANQIAIGQAASWALPSTWLFALLSGSLRGLAIYSERYDDYALFQAQLSGVLEITYRIPA